VRALKIALPALAGIVALPAFATTSIDVSSIVTLLSGDVTTAVTSVGVAVLAVLGIVLGFKMVRRAF
jgi:hypothetical protein